MSIENSQLQGILNEALTGKTLLIQVTDQVELNSNKVRLYRIRRSMESKIPDILSRVSISQKTVEGKHFISVGPPKELPVFVEDNAGTLVKREAQGGSVKDLTRLINLLLKDSIPLDEVKEILSVWPKGAMTEYFRIRADSNGHNSQEA